MIANVMKPQEYLLNTIKVIVTLMYCLIKLMYESMFFLRGVCVLIDVTLE
jgi:hypothetical protein